jgi:hypothetical protein
MPASNVESIKMVQLENHDYLIQPTACGQGISGLDLITLCVTYNEKINVSFMKSLKTLYAGGKCGIEQKSIDGLDLITLYVTYNVIKKY